MMKTPLSMKNPVDIVSIDDGDMDVDGGPSVQKLTPEAKIIQPAITKSAEGGIIRRAKMYQEYFKKVPIPTQRGSLILCNSWMGLAKSIKEQYGQPLHYLTNVLLKHWDQARFETCDDSQPLDSVIHPLKAEATIWFIEEVHRQTASYHQLSKLWARDPAYHAFIDPIIPKI